MKSLIFKIILVCGAGIILASSAISVLNAFPDKMPSAVWSLLHLVVIVSLFVYLVFVLRHFVVKRITKLSDATKEVTGGNFEISLPNKGKDQISLLTKNFNIMTKDLKANQHINKEFSRNFSHEMKTPLASIMGFAESIANSSKDKKIVNEAIIIIEEAKRLSDLSQSILQLSQLDNMSIIPSNDQFNPSSQISSIVVSMQQAWEEKKIEFDINADNEAIISNESLVYQIWKNLISNAVKYASEKSKIKIDLSVDNGQLIFVITNQGQVISDDDKSKIFSLFFVGDKSRTNKNSTGVGLTLTKTIVEKLEGDISFTSNQEGETTFRVLLKTKSIDKH